MVKITFEIYFLSFKTDFDDIKIAFKSEIKYQMNFEWLKIYFGSD